MSGEEVIRVPISTVVVIFVLFNLFKIICCGYLNCPQNLILPEIRGIGHGAWGIRGVGREGGVGGVGGSGKLIRCGRMGKKSFPPHSPHSPHSPLPTPQEGFRVSGTSLETRPTQWLTVVATAVMGHWEYRNLAFCNARHDKCHV